MAKKSVIARNDRRRRMCAKLKAERAKLKTIIRNRKLSLEVRFKAQAELDLLPRDSSTVRIRNRCELSGRARGYYGKFRLARTPLRQSAVDGLIPGLIKASW